MNLLLPLQLLFLWSMLFFVSREDLKTGYIKDRTVLVFSALILLLRLLDGTAPTEILYSCVLAFAFYGSIYLIGWVLYHREAFGQGDVIFFCGIGTFFPPLQTLLAGIFAFYFVLAGILLRLRKQKWADVRGMSIAFGPYMSLAAFFMSLLGTWVEESLLGML